MKRVSSQLPFMLDSLSIDFVVEDDDRLLFYPSLRGGGGRGSSFPSSIVQPLRRISRTECFLSIVQDFI